MKKLLLLVLSLTLALSLSGCILEPGVAGNVEFALVGDNIIEITTAETYLELGFIADDNGTDISSYVTVVGDVDSREPGVYFIEYTLDYDSKVRSLLRAVVVTETGVVVDADEVLYPDACTDVSIHFIDIDSMGDSILIDCGDFEVVIDAGLKSVGTNILVPYLNNYVDDGVIELIIATHPDADHIGGFIGLSGQAGIFNSFEVERVLDFGYEKSTITTSEYIALRDSEMSGTTAALVCSGDDALNSSNLCQPYYTIMSDLILTVVDTGHYDGEDTTNDNENSIVVMLQHGDNTFLFTGDAEENAEAFMSDELTHIDVLKAGHHGSGTASTDLLLNAITPTDIILCVDFPDDDDGENGYGIPPQDSLDRMFAQTDNIYATGVSGTIVIASNGTTYTITGTDNTTLFKDSVWFSTHRTYPTN